MGVVGSPQQDRGEDWFWGLKAPLEGAPGRDSGCLLGRTVGLSSQHICMTRGTGRCRPAPVPPAPYVEVGAEFWCVRGCDDGKGALWAAGCGLPQHHQLLSLLPDLRNDVLDGGVCLWDHNAADCGVKLS